MGVMSETFEPAAGDPVSREEAGATPLERFILDEVEPQRDELNTWGPARSHLKLLLDTAQGQKLKPKKIGGKDSRAFTLTRSGKQVEGIQESITTLVSHQALRATESRDLRRQCLTLSEIPHVKGRTFHVAQNRSAAKFHRDVGQPLSIKPASERAHGETAANLVTQDQFEAAWERVAAACSALPVPKQLIDIEVFLPWIGLRVFVVGEKAVAAVARVPLYIIGDGTQTAHQLAEQERQRRNSCAFLDPVQDPTAQNMVEALPLDPDNVLKSGNLQLLTYDRNGQTGSGWSIDVTDRISSELAGLAINATWAFPGLGASAVDILTPSLASEHRAVVADVDPQADMRECRYPAYGQPRYPNLEIMKRISGA